MSIDKKLKKIFSKILEINESEIVDMTSPSTCSSWDSYNMMQIIFLTEEEFNISIPIEEVVKVKNFIDYLNLIIKIVE